MLAVVGCPAKPRRDQPLEQWRGAALSAADALAIASAEHDAESPVDDELFEQAVLVELVTVPNHEAPVFKVSFSTKLDGDDEPWHRHYFVDSAHGTILEAR